MAMLKGLTDPSKSGTDTPWAQIMCNPQCCLIVYLYSYKVIRARPGLGQKKLNVAQEESSKLH